MSEAEQLSILAPITITDALLSSSTVAENDGVADGGAIAYNAATPYALAARCISTTTHRIYESAQAANTGHDPTDINNRVPAATAWWIDVGPTNKYAMFDGVVSTPTVDASPLTVVIEPGFFNAVVGFGFDADTLTITVKDAPGGNVIYSDYNTLENSLPSDYYDYFYAPYKVQRDYIDFGIEQYLLAEVTLTFTHSSGDISVGMLALGDLRPLGETQYGAKVKPKTYSYIKVDEFGNNTIMHRKTANDLSATAYLAVDDANRVLETITELLDVPCAVIGSTLPQHSGMRVFGLLSGEISYDQPNDCLLTATVQGLI